MFTDDVENGLPLGDKRSGPLGVSMKPKEPRDFRLTTTHGCSDLALSKPSSCTGANCLSEESA